MQGQLNDNKGFLGDVKSSLSDKELATSFFSFTNISIPRDTTDAKSRIDINIHRYKSYYMAVTALLFLFYVLYKPMLLILIGIISVCAYLYKTKPTLFNVEIEPKAVTTGAIVGTLVFFIMFKDYIVGLLAMVSFCAFLVLGHASAKLTEDYQNEKETV